MVQSGHVAGDRAIQVEQKAFVNEETTVLNAAVAEVNIQH